MEFRVLGSLEVRRDGAPVAVTGVRGRRLLAALLVDAGHVVAVERLAQVLWADDQPGDPRNAVQTAIARLRDRLGEPNPVVTRPPGYLIDVEVDELDAARFDAALDQAHREREDPDRVRSLLQDALGLWRGDAYAEFDHAVVRAEAVRLEERRVVAIERLAEARLRLGDVHDAAVDLEAELARQPLRERLVELRMQVLARSDRPADALAVYRAYRRRLADETGLEPSPSVQVLEGRILRGELAGKRRTADRSRRTHAERTRIGPRLPVVTTSLIGRETELSVIRELLATSGPVTITGSGGVGKTRLALAVAGSVQDQPGRAVAWVELAAVDDPAAIAHVVAEATEIDLSGASAPAVALVEALSGRELFLVVDNAEHLIEPVARLVADVARCCPAVDVLVTSRQPLSIQGERLVALRPLPTAVDTAIRSPAVELFEERAERAGARLGSSQQAAVEELCRELEGLPLAIELAAARTAVLPPTELLELLRADGARTLGSRRGQPTRHRDLWSVVDWSYQLLDGDEQLLFERLGVFAGGFDVSAVHAVCAADGWAVATTMRHLATLAERSLVSPEPRGTTDGPGRYRILRPLRELSRQRSADRGELAMLVRRYVDHVVAEVERAAGPPLHRAGRQRLLELLDDVREVRRRSRLTEDLDRVGRLVIGLYRFEYLRRGAEFLGWAEQVVAHGDAERRPYAPQLYAGAAVSAWRSGDLRRAGALARTGAGLGGGRDDPARRFAVEALGDVATFEGRLTDAGEHFIEAVRLARLGGDPDTEALGLASLAIVRAYGGDVARAQGPLDEAAGVMDVGDGVRAFVQYARGECLADEDPRRAIALVDDAADLARSSGSWFVDGVARLTSASLRARHGDPLEAIPVFADLVEHWRSSGSWPQQWTTLRNLAELLVRVGADDLAVVVASGVGAHQPQGAVFGPESVRLDEAMATARRRLGADRLEHARQQGAAMTRQQLVDHALDGMGRTWPP